MLKKKQIIIKEVEGPNQIHPTLSTIKVIIKNQSNNSGRSYDTKKKLKQGSMIKEIKISKVK